MSPGLIKALAEMLYEFIPEVLNKAFSVTSKEEILQAAIINEIISLANIAGNEIGVVLKRVIKVIKKKANCEKTDLTWKFSYTCNICGANDISSIGGEFSVKNQVEPPLHLGVLRLSMGYAKHCEREELIPVYESYPKIYIINFMRMLDINRYVKYNTAKSHPTIACKIFGRLVEYSLHSLILHKRNNYACTVVFTENNFYVKADKLLSCQQGIDLLMTGPELLCIIYQAVTNKNTTLGVRHFFTILEFSLSRSIVEEYWGGLDREQQVNFTEDDVRRPDRIRDFRF